MNATCSLFWILAGIEVGIAAVWLAINAASLDSWFAELVKRIMFIGLFAFILDRGPEFAKAVVDSPTRSAPAAPPLPPISSMPAFVSRTKMSEQARSSGLWQDNGTGDRRRRHGRGRRVV